jgi:apoptosis-inducing factor 3
MVHEEKKLAGPDLTQGIALDELPDDGMLVGHAGDEQVLLVRRGSEVLAVGAQCTHYQGPLAEGLLVGDTVRCPWHHGCFDLRTGEALRAPALSPLACWNVEQRDGKIAVREKRERPNPKPRGKAASEPEKIVIIGGGAAGFAAAEMLRRQGYQNSIIMLSSDDALPYDRPNLSKDYLAGTIPFDYVPLRDDRFYADNGIDTRIGQTAGSMSAKWQKDVHAQRERAR